MRISLPRFLEVNVSRLCLCRLTHTIVDGDDLTTNSNRLFPIDKVFRLLREVEKDPSLPIDMFGAAKQRRGKGIVNPKRQDLGVSIA